MKSITFLVLFCAGVCLQAQEMKVFNKNFFSFEVPANWSTPDPDEENLYPYIHIPMGAIECEVSVYASTIYSVSHLTGQFSMPMLEPKDTIKTNYLTFEYFEYGRNKCWLHEDVQFNLVVFSQGCPDHIPLLELVESIQAQKPKTVWKSYKKKEIGLILNKPKHWQNSYYKSKDNLNVETICPYEDLYIDFLIYPTVEETKAVFDEITPDTENLKTDYLDFLVKIDNEKSETWYFTKYNDQALILKVYPTTLKYFCRYNVLNDFLNRMKPMK